MARYIDREQALSHPFANGHYDHESVAKSKLEDFILGYEGYKEWLETLPTADVRENVHGKWRLTEASPHWLYCDKCYKRMLQNAEWVETYNIPTNYCPNCGADMRKEQK